MSLDKIIEIMNKMEGFEEFKDLYEEMENIGIGLEDSQSHTIATLLTKLYNEFDKNFYWLNHFMTIAFSIPLLQQGEIDLEAAVVIKKELEDIRLRLLKLAGDANMKCVEENIEA